MDYIMAQRYDLKVEKVELTIDSELTSEQMTAFLNTTKAFSIRNQQGNFQVAYDEEVDEGDKS
jgi:hypothetical protein